MQCKCVTYDGDVYEPGTMTGGSDMNTQFILPRYRDLRLIDEKIQQLKEENMQLGLEVIYTFFYSLIISFTIIDCK